LELVGERHDRISLDSVDHGFRLVRRGLPHLPRHGAVNLGVAKTMNLIESVKARFAKEPATEPALWEGWNRVCDRIHTHALAMRPKPKSFEVHHLTETARKAYLESFVSGTDIAVAESAALASIGAEK
jgi:hypothetical protein